MQKFDSAPLSVAMHRQLLRRYGSLMRLRPGAAGAFLLKLLAPENRRRIVTSATGVRFYADPFTDVGRALALMGSYEPATESIFCQHVRRGDCVLDIGANEGYLSALAGRLVGPDGVVISVEPQARLRDLLEINLRLNDVQHYLIYTNAIGRPDGAEGVLHLWPSLNAGASSVLGRYRFSRATQAFTYVSPERILRDAGRETIDVVKVDVEGFEGQVVTSLTPLLQAQQITKLFIDYHASLLARAGIDARGIHQAILNTGYRSLPATPTDLGGYILYERPGA